MSDRTRGFTAPGCKTLVALDGDAVAGLVQLQSHREVQAHLSALVVGAGWRRRGLGRLLLREALADCYLAVGVDPIPEFGLREETIACAR